jgi:hypothetical protein
VRRVADCYLIKNPPGTLLCGAIAISVHSTHYTHKRKAHYNKMCNISCCDCDSCFVVLYVVIRNYII